MCWSRSSTVYLLLFSHISVSSHAEQISITAMQEAAATSCPQEQPRAEAAAVESGMKGCRLWGCAGTAPEELRPAGSSGAQLGRTAFPGRPRAAGGVSAELRAVGDGRWEGVTGWSQLLFCCRCSGRGVGRVRMEVRCFSLLLFLNALVAYSQ